MSNSSLVTYKRISPNRTSPRQHEIDTITIHCVVAQWTAKQTCDYFNNTAVNASSNYTVGHDGSIGLCVEEKDRSWCTSSRSNDHRAITIEVASDRKHPYAVTDKAYNALIDLLVDICQRNPSIGKLKWEANKYLVGQPDKQNMTVHRWFADTHCPGEYLYSRHDDIVEKVNARLEKADLKVEVEVENNSKDTAADIKVGDIVEFIGNKQYTSSNAKNGVTATKSTAKVTVVSKNAKHPYHVRAIDNKGQFNNKIYGWVDAADLMPKKTITPTPAPTPAPTPTPIPAPTPTIESTEKVTIQKGDLVSLAADAKYYNGQEIPAFVLQNNWYVSSIAGTRAVIDKSEDGSRSIKSPVHTKFLTKVEPKKKEEPKVETFKAYTVRVTAKKLNIRRSPSMLGKIDGVITDQGIYTIIAEDGGWGKLKSSIDAGYDRWISLQFTKKV